MVKKNVVAGLEEIGTPILKLINNQTLDQIKEINNEYLKKIPNAKSIAKKHHKSKR